MNIQQLKAQMLIEQKRKELQEETERIRAGKKRTKTKNEEKKTTLIPIIKEKEDDIKVMDLEVTVSETPQKNDIQINKESNSNEIREPNKEDHKAIYIIDEPERDSINIDKPDEDTNINIYDEILNTEENKNKIDEIEEFPIIDLEVDSEIIEKPLFITENMKAIPKSENEQIPKTAQPKVRLIIKIR